jgi:cis-3-alkyl-4-acyloxetan-2-one decarboxylase
MNATELPEDVRALYPWPGEHLPVGGGRMHYLDVGPKDGPPVIFLHGNPTWSFYWRDLIRGLSDKYRCVAPDHIGHGLSDKPEDWSYRLADHIANAVALFDHLDLRDATVVVHDWGGAIGTGLTLARPDRVKRLVIFNTAAFQGPVPASIRMCRWPVVGGLLVRGANGFLRGALVRGTKRRDRFRGPVGAAFTLPYHGWKNRVGHHKFVLDIPIEADHPSRATIAGMESRLQELRGRPTMILWGMQDFCFTPAFLQRWRQELPDAEVHEFPAAGHWVVEDESERVVPLVREFLDRT